MSFDYSTPAITKWQLDSFIEVVDAFEDEFASTVTLKTPVRNDYKTILMHIAGKALVTTREILTLCAHGYPDGALSLGRNLYEQMMIISYFETHKDSVNFQEDIDDFFLSYEVQRNKCLRDIDKYIPDGNISTHNEEAERLKKRTKKRIKGDYWWTGFNTFSDLADNIIQANTDKAFRNFLGKHYATYKRACISLHAGCMGNMIRIGSDTGFAVIDTSPTLYGQSTSLIFAATSLVAIIGTLCSNFNIDHEKYLTVLNELLINYQKQEKEDMNH